MTPERRLDALGIELPPVMAPTAAYVPAVQTGDLLFLAGHNPWEDGEIRITGAVGTERTIDDGYRAARIVALNLLTTLKAELGELERVRDALTARLAHARALQAERGAAQEAARVRLERMLLAPGEHRFERVAASELGEGGCGVYAVRPRLGLIGMLAGWWHVKLSSGCPRPT